ncbi:DDE-type integrase/transposase/recombinase [bacterium]|nr:DDE-type integrase/transposase/recombinase [bacterium]
MTQSWRLSAGWKLRTIAFYSKTFDAPQQNYATFDKESAAILLCCRKWAKLITCRPTTIYTDSAVAASMLTKHLGPPRLQRWGMELGTFMPYLKIQYRKGDDNGMADFLSRWPTFERYCPRPEGVAQLPDDLFEDLQEIPLFTHQLGPDPDQQALRGWKYTLCEARDPKELEQVWQAQVTEVTDRDRSDHHELSTIAHFSTDQDRQTSQSLPSIAALFADSREADTLPERIAALREFVTQHHFWTEQAEFEEYASAWEDYVDIFTATHGRPPVLYDFYCGEGGFSRGARAAGVECYGFDIEPRCRLRYETEPGTGENEALDVPSCMTFTLADLDSAEFWDELRRQSGRYSHLPLPDMIHASPPCSPFSKIMYLNTQPPATASLESINLLIRRLRDYEAHLRSTHSRPLPWQIENVPGSEQYVTEPVTSQVQLCGTMMGNRVFRHRNFYCSYPAKIDLPHRHEGKLVGSRGVRGSIEQNEKRYAGAPEPNMYGVYSRIFKGRGTSAEWHGALGAIPSTYSAEGIRGVLPLGYGRLLASQMAAHHMHLRYGMPVAAPSQRDDTLSGAIRLWREHGYAPVSHLHAIGSMEPCVEPPPPFQPALYEDADLIANMLPDATAPVDSPYVFGRDAQLADPIFGPQIELLEKADARPPSRRPYVPDWQMHGGQLYKIQYLPDGSRELKLAVPDSCRLPLMAHFHYLCHRGHKPLVDSIADSYYWPNFKADCLEFTSGCTTCQQRTSQPLARAATQPIPTPARPFSVLHLDHKGPLPARRSDKYNHILVVVCALTRFTLLIPVETVTAEETLRTVVSRVFSIFGYPVIIVSDNGPAFISHLGEAMADFFGYRHIHVLPYNAQANGVAESAVKRIKLLLDRQTAGYRDWHRLLPIMQLLLNSVTHTSTGLSPYCALFGREPDGLERLENPALYPDGDGHQFLTELRGRMVHLHRELQKYSDDIKAARVREDNERLFARMQTSRHGQILPSSPAQDRFVWMLHGSKEQATYLRKHGHGTPWRYKYKVLEVKPHAVRLEVPNDGSVPQVNEWQLIRRISPAHEGEHTPDENSPVITDMGVPLPSVSPDVHHHHGDCDDGIYDIERISHAQGVGNVYRIWIKWRHYDELTWRWRHELVQETSNAEVLEQIEQAVTAERARLQALRHEGAEVEDTPPQDVPIDHEQPLLGRGHRVRPPVNYQLGLSSDDTSEPQLASYRRLCKALLFFVDYDLTPA